MSGATISMSVSEDGSQAKILVKGALTIENIAEFRQTLAGALDTSNQVVLDISEVHEVDITVAQTICSACKTAAASQRSLVAAGALPDCIQGLGKGIGAPHGVPCCQNHNEPCTWFGGTK